MPVLRYIETFFRRRWIVTIPALILLCSSALLVLVAPRPYKVVSRVWTERSDYLRTGIDNPYVTPAQIQTGRFRELISTKAFSRAIADRTSAGAAAGEENKQRLVEIIQKGLHAWEAGEHSIHVEISLPDPQLALEVVNVAVEEFNRVSLESQNLQAQAAIRFYQERITLYERDILPKSGSSLLAYLEQHPEVRRNLQENGPRDPQYDLLQQQADWSRQQYEQYKQRLDEVLLQSEADQKNQEVAFRFIDTPAVEPGGGKLGKKTLLMYAGLGVAISIGYIAVFLILATELDSTLRNASDVRSRLHLPILEVVPDYNERRSSDRSSLRSSWSSRRRSPRPLRTGVS